MSFAAWYALIVLVIGAVLSYTDRYVLNVLIDGIRRDLALRDIELSLAQGPAFAIIYAVAALPLGRLADRVNRRRIILGGLVVWSAGTAGCGLATNLEQLLIARFIVGVGEACYFPAAISMLADALPPTRRGLGIGALFMGAAAGGGAAVVVGGGLLAVLPPSLDWPILPSDAPWRGVLVILAGMGLPVLIAVALIREPPRVVEDLPGEARGALQVARDGAPVLLPLLVVLGLVAVIDAAAASWTPTYFSRVFQFSPGKIAALLGTGILLAGAVGYLAGGLLADALEQRSSANARVTVALLCAPMAMILLSYTLVPAGLALVLYWLLIFVLAVLNVAASSAFLKAVPNALQGTASAILAFVLILTGLASGPTLVAAMTDMYFQDEKRVNESILFIGIAVLLPAFVVLWRLRRAQARYAR
jgi:MFS family permease